MKLLQNKEIDSNETSSVAQSFLSSTIRSIILSSASSTPGKESEIDKRLNQISLKEVSDHDCYEDCWIIIYDRVYDVTTFLNHVSLTCSSNSRFCLESRVE